MSQLGASIIQQEVEKSEWLHKFESWSSQDQVNFVERLISKMGHCQHRQIEATLVPLLERDFISMLGGVGLGDLAGSVRSNSPRSSPIDPDSLSGGSPVVSSQRHSSTIPGAIGTPHPSQASINLDSHNNDHHHNHNHHNNNNVNNNLSNNIANTNNLNNNNNNISNALQNSITNNNNNNNHQLTAAQAHFADALINLPIKSQCKRQKMIYHCKFGEFGVMDGQFTEPSGVAVNAQNDIIVADTNNHRIQIFDKEGRFKFQFGECGKRDGQLLYPNRVAVVKSSGDIIVTERSPTHQIQIYNQYGQFVRKFGANILQHPRGVTVDNKGRIIVVECKVMRVIIFNQFGDSLHKFGCSKHLEFPNGVVVNDKQEIFISDNRAHCVKVFSYEGQFLRQIGGEGLTNYPIGVCINDVGEILVADNHNNFNITIFNQDGSLISALESKVKHAQCFDVALMDDNSVVLASKDYRIYIYRYLQVQALTAMAFEKY